MFKIIKKQIRPNINVPFWQGQNDPDMTDEFKNYFYENYILAGKFISSTPSVSADGLELTTAVIWDSEADFNACMADPVAQEGLIGRAQSHFATHGITIVEISKETF